MAKKKVYRYDGIDFDSQAEAGRYIQLVELREAGHISHIVPQPGPWRLHCWGERNHPAEMDRCLLGVYTPDFAYWDHRLGELVVEDVKGFKGGKGYDLFVFKCKIMEREHGIHIVPVYNTRNHLTELYQKAVGTHVEKRRSKKRPRISNNRSRYTRRSDVGRGGTRRK